MAGTFLCKALEATGIAGIPTELFNFDTNLLDRYKLAEYTNAQEHLWNLGSTGNPKNGDKDFARSKGRVG